jgi:phage minor structural protein, N-terminal domain protein
MLFDRDESFISSLKYNNIRRHREINGLNTLEFETNREVEFGQRLLFKDKQGNWHEYIIIDYFKTHDENGVTYEVFCEDSTSELYGFFIEDMKPRDATASNVLGRILEGTRFEVGYVDDFGKESFNIYRTSVKSALWKMLEKYKAEIKVRLVVGKQGIEHRYIDLRQSIGRNVGKTFTYKKDIGSIKKTTSTKDLVTALYGFGKGEEVVGDDGQPSGGYGRKIDFAEINGGKKYVADEEARKKYGLGKERVHIFGSVDFDDCEDREELLDLTKEKLKELSKPKITYELNVEDISRYDGYIGEGVDLGDIVLVKDKMIDTLVQTRVIAIKDNPIEEVQDSEIVLGNFIKDLSDNMVAYDKLKSIFENDRNRFNDELERLANGVRSSYIQSILEKFNKELNETGGWVYAEEGEGLLILNAPREGNPTQAINLKGGMIAIANHKNADGSFAYETFGDGNGFTANLIRAGVLRGGKVFFNLEDGTFLIGESRTNYSMFWDGTTLHLRDVDIDLSNNYQIQNINNNISDVDKKIDSTKIGLDSGIGDLKANVDAFIKVVEADISRLDTTIDVNRVEIINNLDAVSDRIDETIKDYDIKFETVDKKIDVVSQDFKVGQGQLESTINSKISGLANIVESNQDGFESYKLNNAKVIGDIRSEIKQTESSIETSIASQIKTVNDKIDSKDMAIRDYVKTNYSTTLQTDEKIKSTVASEVHTINSDLLNNYDTKAEVDAKIKSADTSLKSYVSTNYSTISQTDSKIDSKVASEIRTINSKIDSKESYLRTYVSKNYSTKTQTSDLIESKVSSVSDDVSDLGARVSTAESKISQTSSQISSKISSSDARSIFRQEASSFTFDASQVNFNSNVSIKGNFETHGITNIMGTYRDITTALSSGAIRFYDNSGYERGSMYASQGLVIRGSSIQIKTGSRASDPRITLDSRYISLGAKEKVTVASDVSCYDLEASKISTNNLLIDNTVYCRAVDISGWRIETSSDNRQLVIMSPGQKRWNFDKYEGFFES